MNTPGKVIKGVRKLRDREAGEWMRLVLSRGRDAGDVLSNSTHDESQISLDPRGGAGGRRLEDIQSADDAAI